MPKTQNPRPKKQRPATATQPIDALTVGWMLTLITTLFCLTVSIAARAYVRYVQSEAAMIATLSGLMLFSAAVIGIVLLVLTPIIVRRKASNPPTGLVFFAYLIGAAPWVSMLLQGWE